MVSASKTGGQDDRKKSHMNIPKARCMFQAPSTFGEERRAWWPPYPVCPALHVSPYPAGAGVFRFVQDTTCCSFISWYDEVLESNRYVAMLNSHSSGYYTLGEIGQPYNIRLTL